uniref:Dof zinc finger protein n=1 Tax=Ananas comosus var. bracteatus TaxID=296719 RepID=A0A6V7NU28_ANACO|nr:unnamed protein product [Ananas comosus var. bracteatus]
MVFTSLPLYLDPPSWNQQQDYQSASSSGGGGHLPPLPEVSVATTAASLVRPGSMADRARLAGLPQPEHALKCPRCESVNTKFCYFNNYSLSQPRHFCKTCRRYWTSGGALRNVPVGGSCRRNKRSSKSKTSSSASANRQAAGTPSSGAIPPDVQPPPAGKPPFMTSLQSIGDYGCTLSDLGLGFSSLHPIEPVDSYQVLGSSSSLGLEHKRMQQIQQFPSFTSPSMQGLHNFNGESTSGDDHGLFGSIFPKVKMEDELRRLNLPREYLGIPRDNQYWGSGDIAGFNSPSSGNIL